MELLFLVLLVVAGWVYGWIINPCAVGNHDWYIYRDELVDLHDQDYLSVLLHAYVCTECGKIRDDISAEKERQAVYVAQRDARHTKAQRRLRELRERGVIR